MHVRFNKPSLASDERVIVDADTTPGLGLAHDIVRTTHPASTVGRTVQTVTGAVIGVAVMVGLVYLLLSTTVFTVQNANGHHVGVLRNKYPVGEVPANAIVYVSRKPVNHGTWGAMVETFTGVPGGAVVQVIAGPTGTVAVTSAGMVTVNGAPTSYTVTTTPGEHLLTREYAAVCIAGGCGRPGALVEVPQSNVVGQAEGYVGFGHLTPVPAPVSTQGRVQS